jgi:transcriptional regulator with XRE-family HTH domain
VKSLREWRIERLLSLGALAKRSGLTKKTVIEAEYGRRQPHYRTIAALCRALDVTPAEVTEFAAALDHKRSFEGADREQTIASR